MLLCHQKQNHRKNHKEPELFARVALSHVSQPNGGQLYRMLCTMVQFTSNGRLLSEIKCDGVDNFAFVGMTP